MHLSPRRRAEPRLLWAALVLVFAACAHVPRAQEDDARSLRALVAERLGSAEARGDRALEAELDALLAAPLDDASAVRVALLANPKLRALYEELGVATADRVQAGRIRNPMASGAWLFGDDGSEVELALVQPFLDLLRVPLRKRIASVEFDAVEASLARQMIELVFDVRRALVDTRAARGRVELARESFEAARASLELAQALHSAGNIGDPALTANEAEVSSARIALLRAEAAEREAREPLSVLFGLERSDGAWSVAGSLADPTADAPEPRVAEERALAASLELAESRARVRAAMERADLTDRERLLANVELGLGAKKDVGEGSWALGPRFSFELPIADAGDARDASARARLRAELERRRALELEVRAAARLAVDRIEASTDEHEILREHHVPAHARLVTELLRTYNAMQIGVFQVLDARRAELDARREQLDARADAARAELDLAELFAGARHAAHAASGMRPMEATNSTASPSAARSGGH